MNEGSHAEAEALPGKVQGLRTDIVGVAGLAEDISEERRQRRS